MGSKADEHESQAATEPHLDIKDGPSLWTLLGGSLPGTAPLPPLRRVSSHEGRY